MPSKDLIKKRQAKKEKKQKHNETVVAIENAIKVVVQKQIAELTGEEKLELLEEEKKKRVRNFKKYMAKYNVDAETETGEIVSDIEIAEKMFEPIYRFNGTLPAFNAKHIDIYFNIFKELAIEGIKSGCMRTITLEDLCNLMDISTEDFNRLWLKSTEENNRACQKCIDFLHKNMLVFVNKKTQNPFTGMQYNKTTLKKIESPALIVNNNTQNNYLTSEDLKKQLESQYSLLRENPNCDDIENP